MTVSIEIRPHSDTVDMYGQPDKSTAYSLSGDVVISLSSSYSLFERRRAVRLILQSLTIEFESQCELITEETGYAPFRLCNVSKELVFGEPAELSNEGHEDGDGPCIWNVAFNLAIPGWLPPSSTYGDCVSGNAGTRYSLYASAKYLNIDDGPSKSLFSFCCAPFRSQIRVVSAPRYDVQINRFISAFVEDPSSSSSSSSSTIDYTVIAEERKDVPSTSGFPFEVISKVRAVVSVPDNVDTNDSSFPICLRLRTQDLAESECKRLRVTGFEIEVEQMEHYRISPSSTYRALYPLPPSSEQPPRRALRDPHPLQLIYEVGLAGSAPTHQTCSRSFSLLPKGNSGHYSLAGDGYVFSNDTDPANSSSWYSMRTHVPFEGRDDKGTSCRLRESGQSPLFGVNHRLHITLTCTYDLTDGPTPERATENLRFQLPIRFARVLPVSPVSPGCLSPSVLSHLSGHSPSSSLDSLSSIASSATGSLPIASLPYAQPLPAYSQLFDANGDRKIDYSIPLPAYTPSCHSSSSSITSLNLTEAEMVGQQNESETAVQS